MSMYNSGDGAHSDDGRETKVWESGESGEDSEKRRYGWVQA